MARLAVAKPRERRISDWGNQLAERYHRSLEWVLNAPWRTVGGCLLAAGLAAGLYTQLDRELLHLTGTLNILRVGRMVWIDYADAS